jgi:hypothetical protein
MSVETAAYLVFNELVEGKPASEPIVLHGGLIADFFMVAGISGMASLTMSPEMGGRYLVSCQELPAHDDMMLLLRSEVPEGQPITLMITPQDNGCRIIDADGNADEQTLPVEMKIKSLQLQGHKIIRVLPALQQP